MSGFMDDLCRLDSERFKFDTNHYLVMLNGATHRVHTDITPGQAVIQAAVQEALEARGWKFDLMFFGQRYGAKVYRPDVLLAETSRESWLTPVMALAVAYIHTLESQR